MNISFSFVDFLIVLIVVVSAGYAAWRGFLSETLSVFAWVSAAFACLYFGPYVFPLARSMVSTWWLANAVAYAVVFLAVFVPMAFMSHRMSQNVKNSPIGPLNRALGLAFGVVRGLVIVGLAYLAFTYFVPIRRQPNWMTEARLLPAVQSTAEALLTVIPHHGEMGPPPEEPYVVGQEPPPQQSHKDDPVGDMIRRQDGSRDRRATPEPLHKEQGGKPEKRYGAKDRQRLDSLFEASGNGK